MLIVGCDFHPSWQQIAVFDSETGEISEHRLVNGDGEAERFYRQLPAPALVGMEASGNSHWFTNLLEELGHEVWIGDASEIRASYVRKQKTDKRDAQHILKLLLENRFPRLWTPSRDAQRAATGAPSPQAGAAAGAGEERTATPGHESGSAEESAAME